MDEIFEAARRRIFEYIPAWLESSDRRLSDRKRRHFSDVQMSATTAAAAVKNAET